MLAWWYRQLPVSSVEVGGVRYPFYHVFHPTEHGRIRVLEPATDGKAGMGVGALVEREEWFGPFDSKGAGRRPTVCRTTRRPEHERFAQSASEVGGLLAPRKVDEMLKCCPHHSAAGISGETGHCLVVHLVV